LENWQSDSLKKVQLTLSQSKKKREVVDDEVDDAMRTSVTRPSDSNTVYQGIVPQH
jgi:hypothetical protein